MTFPKLQAGDVFGTRNPMALGTIINAMQRFNSSDGEARYSHSGIVQNELGLTLEALWTVAEANIFQKYGGKQVIIARPRTTPQNVEIALSVLKDTYMGRWYPLWRLPFHVIPPVAKYLTAGGRWLVCSELVARYEFMLSLRHGQFTGTSPDTLADEWHHWKEFDVIFEGILPRERSSK